MEELDEFTSWLLSDANDDNEELSLLSEAYASERTFQFETLQLSELLLKVNPARFRAGFLDSLYDQVTGHPFEGVLNYLHKELGSTYTLREVEIQLQILAVDLASDNYERILTKWSLSETETANNDLDTCNSSVTHVQDESISIQTPSSPIDDEVPSLPSCKDIYNDNSTIVFPNVKNIRCVLGKCKNLTHMSCVSAAFYKKEKAQEGVHEPISLSVINKDIRISPPVGRDKEHAMSARSLWQSLVDYHPHPPISGMRSSRIEIQLFSHLRSSKCDKSCSSSETKYIVLPRILLEGNFITLFPGFLRGKPESLRTSDPRHGYVAPRHSRTSDLYQRLKSWQHNSVDIRPCERNHEVKVILRRNTSDLLSEITQPH